MKIGDMIALGLASIALYFIFKGSAASGGGASSQPYTRQVGEWEGWQYFSDGTAIGPSGDYYYQGQKVWG